MATCVPNVTLGDGVKMPLVGLGTYQGTDNPPASESENIINSFKTAIDQGYRHFDTAAVYNTEQTLGAAIAAKVADGTVRREDLFITTKLNPRDMRPERVVPALKTSLSKLGLDYVDNYIIHWPVAMTPDSTREKENIKYEDVPLTDTWKAMEECRRLGLTRTIGVSNFNRRQMQMVLDNCTVKPSNNQCEVHVLFQNTKLREFCRQNDVAMVCYSPLADPGSVSGYDIPNEPTLMSLGQKYSRTSSQIALRFLVQEGLVVIPKSSNPTRQLHNISLFDFLLSDDDMVTIRALDKNIRMNTVKQVMGDSKEYPFREEF